MSLDPATLDAMVAAGFSAEQIATVVKAELLAERARVAAADEARRAKAAEKKRRQRAEARLVSLDVPGTDGDAWGQSGTSGDNEGQTGTAEGADDKEGPQTPIETTPSEITPSAPKGASVPKGTERRRGCRIPDGFEHSDEARQVAADFGLTGEAADEALAEFADYWRPLPGLKATKLDWIGTLRNRLREVARRRPAVRASPQRSRSSNGYFDILRDELAGPDDQRSDPQQRQHLRLASGAR